MQKSAINIEDDTKGEVSTPDLARLTAMGKFLHKQLAAYTIAELALKELGSTIRKLQEETLPEAMASAGVTSFKLDDGVTIEIKPSIRANIPSATAIEKADDLEKEGLQLRRGAAFAWLRETGNDSIIKNELTLNFGKGEAKKAEKLKEQLEKKGLKPHLEETVHPSTLLSFVKEMLEGGKPIPIEPFGIYQGKKAEVKLPRAPKKLKAETI